MQKLNHWHTQYTRFQTQLTLRDALLTGSAVRCAAVNTENTGVNIFQSILEFLCIVKCFHCKHVSRKENRPRTKKTVNWEQHRWKKCQISFHQKSTTFVLNRKLGEKMNKRYCVFPKQRKQNHISIVFIAVLPHLQGAKETVCFICST